MSASKALETLWFNTGTLCNLTCRNCYIESSPRNDRLVYLTAAEVGVLPRRDRARRPRHPADRLHRRRAVHESRAAGDAATTCCRAGFKAMVLTNAMKPMHKMKPALLGLLQRHGAQPHAARLDRPLRPRAARGRARGAQLAADHRRAGLAAPRPGFDVHVAGRRFLRKISAGACGLRAAVRRARRRPSMPTIRWPLVLFPEMDATVDVPESRRPAGAS